MGVIGKLLRFFSVAFVAPFVLAIVDADYVSSLHFVAAGLVSYAFGSFLSTRFEPGVVFRRSEALGVVAGSWLILGHVGAIPYFMAGLSPEDALFESISGFTTTGATILRDFDLYGRSFFLWRSMTQWFGGLGVIALFVVILPQLGIAGRQLLFTEASGAPGEAVSPQARNTATRLWILYILFTAIQAGLLRFVADLSSFDAICHSMTTMAAGGFSPEAESVMGLQNPTAEWIIIVFMMIAGTSFPLLWTTLTKRPLELFRDGEFRFYIICLTLAAVGLAFILSGGFPDLSTLRTGLFQSLSLITGTGYASADYSVWVDGALILLVFVMLVSGCAGSAAGGVKAIRNLLFLKFIWREITRVLHPRAVIPLRYKGRAVPNEILRAVLTILLLYLLGYFVLALLLILLGQDLITGFSASLACLGNIGPALGGAGPMDSYAHFNLPSKLVLTIAMWIGRLEIVTVLALLHPHVWLNLSWRKR